MTPKAPLAKQIKLWLETAAVAVGIVAALASIVLTAVLGAAYAKQMLGFDVLAWVRVRARGKQDRADELAQLRRLWGNDDAE